MTNLISVSLLSWQARSILFHLMKKGKSLLEFITRNCGSRQDKEMLSCVCVASPIIIISNRDVTKVSTVDCNADKDISKEVNART
jgi:hypothetical protein